MDLSMFPMLAVALLLWFGFFAFMLMVDRRVSRLERDITDMQQRRAHADPARADSAARPNGTFTA